MTNTPDDAINAALWRVIATHGWPGLSMGRLAAEADVPVADLRARFATRLDVLLAHGKAMDRAVLAGTVGGQGGAARDRLFDALMRRLDAMQPHREGILRLMRDMRRDPGLAVALAPHIGVSMRWMLDAAEIGGEACARRLLAVGLAGVWFTAVRAWAEDDSEDLGTTMAALDRAIDRAGQVARSLRLLPEDPALPEDSAPADDPLPPEPEAA